MSRECTEVEMDNFKDEIVISRREVRNLLRAIVTKAAISEPLQILTKKSHSNLSEDSLASYQTEIYGAITKGTGSFGDSN